MNLGLRIALYPAAGALLLVMLDPPQGWVSALFVVGFIIAAAYFDSWVNRAVASRDPRQRENVVSIDSYRNHKFRKGGPFRLRPNPNSKSVYRSPDRLRADELYQALLADGLSPRVVQRQQEDSAESLLFEVRLPENQIESARPTIQRFQYRTANSPR